MVNGGVCSKGTDIRLFTIEGVVGEAYSVFANEGVAGAGGA